ncbi:hypothetical protein Taro_000264 [Colocasia esculenta]|uniref:Uncharacterized protein n=1 Tax=Colocasia esculenta TaxID=4460 RepID=A0A843TAA7_COLES|nr:hypothetical protein [Colocasia esculenta]
MRLPASATSEHRNWRRRQKQKHWRRWWKEGAAAVAWEGGSGSGEEVWRVSREEVPEVAVYVIDFDLAKKYRDTSTHQHIPYSETCITYSERASEAMLAALINGSIGVICTNTAALQLANAREKRSIALFSSEEKGIFVPNEEEKRCVIISSKTRKLADIDVDVLKTSVQQEFAGSLMSSSNRAPQRDGKAPASPVPPSPSAPPLRQSTFSAD